MPTPEGIISTSEGPVAPVEELDTAIAEADAEEATEEYVAEEDKWSATFV